MNVAIIPARGGSKRIPKKNIRPFCGRPIIAYPIAAALESGLFDLVAVSTDSEEIAATARELGAAVPFMRPAALADDFTGTTPVVRHAVETLLARGDDVRAACCLYATTPFITAADLVRGHACLRDAPAAFSVTTFPYPIHRGVRLDNRDRVSLIWPEHRLTRSQDLLEAYHDCGQFYWATTDFLLCGKEFMDGEAVGVRIPRHRVQDIDTEEDWVRAEAMYRVLKETGEL